MCDLLSNRCAVDFCYWAGSNMRDCQHHRHTAGLFDDLEEGLEPMS